MITQILKIVNNYQENFRAINAGLLFSCPCCKKKLHRHGYYSRKIILIGVLEVEIRVQRYYCPICKKTYSQLPNFAVKNTAIAAVTIEEIISLHKDGVSIYKLVKLYSLARSTIKRYIAGWGKHLRVGTLEVGT